MGPWIEVSAADAKDHAPWATFCLRWNQAIGTRCKVTAMGVAEAEVVVTHPNRDTPETNGARMAVVVLFGLSILLMLAILAFGWSVLEGMLAVSFGYILIYAILIWRVSSWARGPLAVGAALAILLAIFVAIAVPTWADRNAPGYAKPEAVWGSAGLPPAVLGLMTMLLVLLQVGVVIACTRAFRQEWQVEVEVPAGGSLPEPGAADPALG